MKKLILILVLASLLLAGCGSDTPVTAEYDITGTWIFTMSELDNQETIYDSGTITFTGERTQGTYVLVNRAGEEKTGTYIVKKVVFGIDGGDEFRVKGSFPEDGKLFGTWESGDSRAGGRGGLWTAEKQ